MRFSGGGGGGQPPDTDLDAVADLTTTGVVVRTGSGTATTRALTAGSTRVTVTNGDGVAGAPTVDVPAADGSTVGVAKLGATGGSLPYDSTTAYTRTLLDDVDAATARGTLGLGTIATQAANSVSISGGSITGITDLAVADGGTGASDASTARTNLGVAIGTNVQAYDAGLASLTSADGSAGLPYVTAADTWAGATLGDLTVSGGSWQVTRARGLRDSGGTTWSVGTATEGTFLKYVGGQIVGVSLAFAVAVSVPDTGDSPMVVEMMLEFAPIAAYTGNVSSYDGSVA